MIITSEDEAMHASYIRTLEMNLAEGALAVVRASTMYECDKVQF